jgi:4-aminobutyrate aminotransferase
MHSPLDASQTKTVSGLYQRDQVSLASCQHIRFAPLEVETGKGAVLVEPGGRELLDLSAGGAAAGLGYAHPAIVQAVSDAVRNMPAIGVYGTAYPDAVELAELLISITPLKSVDPCVYLGLAGSDANSAVIQGIRSAMPGKKILAFHHSYHGGFGASQSISGVWNGGEASSSEVDFVPYGDTAVVRRALAVGDVAAVFVEPVLCDGGIVIAPDGYLSALRELCDRYGTLLVVDEVKVGLGRTGHLFAFQRDGVTPDIVTLGKTLGGGLPLSAAIAPREILGAHAATSILTMAGNSVSVAAGLAALKVILAEDYAGRGRALGQTLSALLSEFKREFGSIVDVRNWGLVGGIELRQSDGGPATELMKRFVYRAWQLGVVFIYVGPNSNVAELTPSLVISDAQLSTAFGRLRQALRDALAGRVTDAEIAPFAGW